MQSYSHTLTQSIDPSYTFTSDSQKLVKAIILKSSSKELHGILYDILQLTTLFSSISLIFVPRSANIHSDKLVKEALGNLVLDPA
ncbi:hypothetical protein V5N11_010754 [Cardamine amara subsp. amara]|uniref:RNase H type-1 domain-containing protein n=1 Tax=Cardamine amara subsp. amara TaxID=228776 RepID=A0ABD0ZJZ4_CARAN